MIKLNIADKKGKLAHFENYQVEGDKGCSLSVTTVGEAHGHFKAISGTTAATTIVTQPTNDGSIVLTDLLLSAEKKNTGTIELRFTDGTNTITIYKAILTDAPAVMAIPFSGRFEGWQDARLEVVTVQDFIYTITCGYYKINKGLKFKAWDAVR